MKQEETIELTISDFPQDVTPQQDKKNYYNPVNEYTMEGVYVKTYKSPTAAARALGISSATVKSCCRGSVLYTVKYDRIFLYKGASIKQRLKAIMEAENNRIRPIAFTIDVYTKKGKLITTCPSIVKAHDKYGIAIANIRKCCTGERLFIKDKIFLFMGSDIKERLKLIKQKEELDAAIEKEILKQG